MSALVTTATLASPKTKSLRATLPEGVVAYLGIADGDRLDWRMEVMEGKKVVMMTKSEPRLPLEKALDKLAKERKKK